MNNKKIYLSLLVIGMAATVAGAGTWAYFTDTATSTENTFTAGVLDLKVGETTSGGISNENFSVYNVMPGDSYKDAGQITVRNNCSVDGYLSARISSLKGNESLAKDLTIYIYDNDPNQWGGWAHEIAEVNSLNVSDNYDLFDYYYGNGHNGYYTNDIYLSAWDSQTFYFEYSVPYGSEEDDYQGQSCSFNIEFKLTQAQ